MASRNRKEEELIFVKVMVIQGPRSSFQSAGANPLLLKCSGGGGGGVDFKNGLPGADSIFC